MSKQMLKFLSQDQIEFYKTNGYLLVEDFASAEEVKLMKQEADKLILGFENDKSISLEIFTTGENQGSERNDYFTNSLNGAFPFFEQKAFDSEKKSLKVPFKQAVNKIGHGLHLYNPVFGPITHCQKSKDICEDIELSNPVIPQSMYILKEAKTGAEVTPHQDSTFLWSDEPSCVGFWIALDDATTENGCLWAIPGSHKGPIRTRFARGEKGLGFEPEIGNTWDIWPKSSFTALPVKAGTMVLIHGALVHMSLENTSDHSRHAYTWHVVSEDQKFCPRNWMGPGPFEKL